VPNADGGISVGERPAWADAPAPPVAAARPAPTSPPRGVEPSSAPPSDTGAGWAMYDYVHVTVHVLERPWQPGTQLQRAGPGMEYVTVEVGIQNVGSAPRRYSAADFRLATGDEGRRDATIARRPEIAAGEVLVGSPVRGWLTFEVPAGARPTGLVWEPALDRTFTIAL
jgi:hypothetical protein